MQLSSETTTGEVHGGDLGRSPHMRWATRAIRDALRLELSYMGGTSTIGDCVAVMARLFGCSPLADGPYVHAYRSALAHYLGIEHVFTYGAGRMAFYALLRAMKLAKGDEIILPGYTCVVIPNAVRFAGLTPIFVDIRSHDFNIDPSLTERAITPRTKGIVVQHTFGIPADMDALLDLSRRRGVPLIEDCAHALGATWGGRQAGTIGYAGFYSTEASKMLSTEKGGILVTADAKLAARLQEDYEDMSWRARSYERLMILRFALRCLSGHPMWNVPITLARLADAVFREGFLRRVFSYDEEDYKRELQGQRTEPYPCRLGNLTSFAGLRQLSRLDRDLAHRRRLVEDLEQIMANKGARIAQYDRREARPSWVRFPFVVDDREAWRARLLACGLRPGVWLDDPIHPAGSNFQFAGYRRGSCPIAERIAKTILNVPVHSRVGVMRVRRLSQLLTDVSA